MPTRRTFDKAEFLPNDNSTPHIVPGVLYPAIGGKLLDGTTSHSGDYGTSQSDSRKYYYTDIKGSGPIRDPRIGAHFGSQRHKFKSIQLLEQETATEGNNVYSVDGREWIRASGGSDISTTNDNTGIFLRLPNSNDFVEIVGYFNEINVISYTQSTRGFEYKLDGGTQSTSNFSNTTVTTPLHSRYVDAGSLINLGISATLGIHTIKLVIDDPVVQLYGIELIAQDTTNAVTRNKIQIPSQTVFSFGSKFTVGGSSAATHYDPFSAKSDGTGWTSPTSGTNNANSSAEWPSNIDTATSLGLAKWVDGTNYYRPYNGGRVVKWVDENGEIKTSVTVMPPNAKSIADSGTLSNATAKSNGSAPNDNFRPTFEAHTSSVNEDLLSEVAKTFHYREFGNGAANGGTGATYADASMLSTTANQTIAYIMDDGLTGLSSDACEKSGNAEGLYPSADSKYWYVTFIGAGINYTTVQTNVGPNQIAQNLPYGTHILKVARSSTNAVITLDGVSIGTLAVGIYGNFSEITINQPKMPPIPEGACIIADYMLMADHIVTSTADAQHISKGVRRLSPTRDVFYQDGTWVFYSPSGGAKNWSYGMGFYASGDSDHYITSFATNAILGAYDLPTRARSYEVDGSVVSTTKSGTGYGSIMYPTSSSTLGVHTFGADGTGTSSLDLMSYDLVTPIHTSHHYKSFETPFLHELIGGDRNMEQTHLICSADGKTWDEVTRDTSYIGNVVLNSTTDTVTSWGTYVILDEWRGSNYIRPRFNKKNFAIAYDRVICLVAGQYILHLDAGVNQTGLDTAVYVNTDHVMSFGGTLGSGQDWVASGEQVVNLQRGDYIQIRGDFGGNPNGMGEFQQNKFIIKKV